MSNIYLVFVLIPLAILFFIGAYIFRFTIRELKRLEGITRSPVLSGFTEVLNGVTTIRSANAISRFLKRHRNQVDIHCGVYRTMWECGTFQKQELFFLMYLCVAFFILKRSTINIILT